MNNELFEIFDIINNFVATTPAYTNIFDSFFENRLYEPDGRHIVNTSHICF